MKNQALQIGLISDTHSYVDERILHHLEGCDEIWHAGDVGDAAVIEALEGKAPVHGVYGNIDGTKVRSIFPEHQLLERNGITVLMIHIAGPFGKYNETTRNLISKHQPDVLVCGHSHILKVNHDKRFKTLYINPGAAGRHGFHKIRTLMRFEVNSGTLQKLKVIELGTRSAKSVN